MCLAPTTPQPLEENTQKTVLNVKGDKASDHSNVTTSTKMTQIVYQTSSSPSSTNVTLNLKNDKVIVVSEHAVKESKHLTPTINVSPENAEFSPPAMLETVVKNTQQTSFNEKQNEVPNQSNITSPRQIHPVDKASGFKETLKSNKEEISDITDSGVNESIQLDNDLTTAVNVSPDVDLNDCMLSVNMDNLKMLSLLDFAGHSAYYACHHLFFSPRAFFILVIDMTKPLENNAIDSCIKEDLIYSNWTYAGN